MAWSVPAVAVASAAPAFGVTSPPPVVAGQCGGACKHPGNSNDKSYHFVFCFTANQPVDGGTVTLVSLTSDGDSAESVAPASISVVANQTLCYYVDGLGFHNSDTADVKLNFTYKVGGVTYNGCANAVVVGDVCGTSGSSPLKDQPKDWPHGPGNPGDPGLEPCVTNPGAGC